MGMIKTPDEIQKMKNVCAITSLILKKLIRDTRVGDTGLDVNKRAIQLFDEMHVDPVFHGYMGFPAAMCISVNEYVLHGIPDGRPFEEGDIIKYDIGGRLEGYCSDTARTFILGRAKTPEHERLVDSTGKALEGIASHIREGLTLQLLAYLIEDWAKTCHLGNVTAYGGHGIGTELHELPTIHSAGWQVRENIILKEGMVLAIEPLYTLGTGNVIKESTWLVKTADGSMGAHFEDDILVLKNGYEILTK